MLLLAALLSWGPPVHRPHDQPPNLAISWATAGASACPTRAVLIDRIAAQGLAEQIGDWVPERHDQAGLSVAIEVEVAGDRWQADLRLRDVDGESVRSFSADSCEALADAAALIVAVTLDPVAVASLHASAATEEQTEPEPAPEPVETDNVEPASEPGIDPPIVPSIALDESSTNEPEPRWPESLQLGLSIHGGAGWGPIASIAGLLGGRVALLGPRWRAELGARWATPRRLETNGRAGIFDAWVIEGRGCFVPGRRRLEFPLCPGVEIGNARGRGVSPTQSPTQRGFLWVAPSLSQGLAWVPVERFAIGVELGLVVPVTRGSFVVGDTTIRELAVVGGRALVNLEFRLP